MQFCVTFEVVLLSFILNLINRYHFFSKYCEDGFLFFLPTCGILALITCKHTVFFAWMQVLINQLVLPATNVEDCITSITEVKVKDLEQVAVTQVCLASVHGKLFNESNQDCSERERIGCRMLWLHT
jgi:hypothetical protein